jgi:hypothetical protein
MYSYVKEIILTAWTKRRGGALAALRPRPHTPRPFSNERRLREDQ